MSYTTAHQILEGQVGEADFRYSITKDQPREYAFVYRSIMYKIFYIFMIGSIFGCYMEQIVYYLQRNIWECRAGVVWGPFSEIYGVGAVLIFLIYKKMNNKSPMTIFILSTICGSMFEYSARLFQEIAFHSTTWDYSKQPFNLGGRTSLKYAICWGVLGLIFIKAIFPVLERKLDQISGRMAFVCTWVLIVFLSVNMIFSAFAVHRWCERTHGISSDNQIELYMDNHYGDVKMKELFPHMKFMEDSRVNS